MPCVECLPSFLQEVQNGWLLFGEVVDLVQQLRDLIAVELLHVSQISPQLLHLFKLLFVHHSVQ